MLLLFYVATISIIHLITLVYKTRRELGVSVYKAFLLTVYVIKSHIEIRKLSEIRKLATNLFLRYDIPLAILKELITHIDTSYNNLNETEISECYNYLLISQYKSNYV